MNKAIDMSYYRDYKETPIKFPPLEFFIAKTFNDAFNEHLKSECAKGKGAATNV